MSKKLLPFLIAFSVCCIALLASQSSAKAEVMANSYNNEVSVSIYLNANMTIPINGLYQLRNNQTGQYVFIPDKTTLTAKADSAKISVTFGGKTYTSTTGFYVEELPASQKIFLFSQNTTMYMDPTKKDSVIKQISSGDTGTYNMTTTSNGETWYNLSHGAYTGWVNATSGSLLTNSALPLSTVYSKTYRGTLFLKKNGSQIEAINYLDMEDYLKGVVPSEMPSSWHAEALKAQAIAARSYAANSMNMTSTAASQVYSGYGAEKATTNKAIKDTEGLLVKYNGKAIQAFFHSSSGGKTANVWDVWNSSKTLYPYLASVSSPYETDSPHNSWTDTFTAAQLLAKFGFSSSTVINDVVLGIKGDNKEIGSITLKTSSGDKTISGNESIIRNIFPKPSPYVNLRTNWFTLTKNGGTVAMSVQTQSGNEQISSLQGQKVQTASGMTTISGDVKIQTASGVQSPTQSGVTSVTLNGKGWGHRIGLSQYGAKGYAERGWTYDQILKHFYTGTTIGK